MRTEVYIWRSVKLTDSMTISKKAWAMAMLDKEKQIVVPVIYISIYIPLPIPIIFDGKGWTRYFWD